MNSHAPNPIRILPFAVLAAVVVCLINLPITNDAAWQIWVGRQMLGGARLYRDIIEINPPLWFWLGAAVSPFGWSGLLTLLGLAAAGSIIVADRLYQSWWLPYALIFAFFLTGISATGQREQFTLVAVTPYVLLTAVRAEGRQVHLPLAVAIGFWAALGFAIKHYFAVVPLALQVWLWFRHRSIAPEFVAVCLVGATYFAAILLFTPEYLTEIVPLIRGAYGSYDQNLSWFLGTDVMLIAAVAIVGLCIARRRDELVQALAISAIAFLCIYVVQLKGYRYQALPALGFSSLMAFVLLSRLDFSIFRSKVAAAILIFVPILNFSGGVLFPPQSKTAKYLCTLRQGTRVLVLAVNGNNAWPAVEICHLNWSSRQMIFWTLASPELSQFTRDEMLHDLASRPDVVVIDKRPRRANPYEFVRSQRPILVALRPYRVVVENQDLVVLQLRTEVSSGPKQENGRTFQTEQ